MSAIVMDGTDPAVSGVHGGMVIGEIVRDSKRRGIGSKFELRLSVEGKSKTLEVA
jgi:hypothetical protein